MKTDTYDLNRFVEAQANSYNRALKEIKEGEKVSHWMWYVFPQINGLGKSYLANKYAIKSREEALEYLSHPILGSRLEEITKSLLVHKDKTAIEIFGFTDAKKLKSSMTLFDEVQNRNTNFREVLNCFFDGKGCRLTLNKIN